MRPGARNLLLFAAGAALFEGSRLLARREQIPEVEERIFRVANGATDAIVVPTRVLMQAGTFGTVPALSVLAFVTGRRRLAAELAVGGTAAWFLAKAAKPFGGRARPAGVLEGVRTREGIEGDLGWVSGHTAVATTLALTASPRLPRWARPFLAGVAAVTGFGRMYVGAHLPLDIVGGAGMGMMLAALVRSTARSSDG
jgi:membrane-associated phospholipid phosphatase